MTKSTYKFGKIFPPFMQVNYKRIHPDAVAPKYQTPGSAAFDFTIIEDINIEPLSVKMARTGLIIKTPENHALIIASRSSSPLKKGVTMANGIGVIDSDYAGEKDEIFLLIKNITSKTVMLKKGYRVAQGMFVPVTRGEFIEVKKMIHESRGGHGSTGR